MHEKLKDALVLLVEISGLLIIFALFLLLLGYFKIITLPNFFPNQQPNNTHYQAASPTPEPTIVTSADLTSIPIGACPLPDGCKNAVQIGDISSNSSKNLSGLGFNLTGSKSAILATFDGKINISDTSENGEALTIMTITDPYNVQQFVYKFKAGTYFPTFPSSNVKQGQKIGDFNNSGTITYASKSYSFIFYMYAFVSKRYIRLQASTDGLTIKSSSQ